MVADGSFIHPVPRIARDRVSTGARSDGEVMSSRLRHSEARKRVLHTTHFAACFTSGDFVPPGTSARDVDTRVIEPTGSWPVWRVSCATGRFRRKESRRTDRNGLAAGFVPRRSKPQVNATVTIGDCSFGSAAKDDSFGIPHVSVDQ